MKNRKAEADIEVGFGLFEKIQHMQDSDRTLHVFLFLCGVRMTLPE